MDIRKIVHTDWATIAEWGNPEEAERDWDSFYNHFVHTCHCGDFIHEGDLVIDIGAHTGDTSIVFGALSHNVIGFEPNPDVFPVFELNCLLNRHMNIHPIKNAVTAENGVYELYDHSTTNCNMGLTKRGKPKFDVVGVNLDYYLFGQENQINFGIPKFIKIDVEGYDINIFDSIPMTLSYKPVVLMEWHNDAPSYFLEHISNAGYGALDPITLEPVKDKVWDVLCLPLI